MTGIHACNEEAYSAFFPLGLGSMEFAVTIDPLLPTNNTTRSAYAIDNVMELFRKAHDKLRYWMNEGRGRDMVRGLMRVNL